jgi:large subunit ribosomal protein L15
MDILSNLKFAPGSHKKKKRVGRGQGSGHGGTSTRGENGQHSRSGAKFRAWFEGGQMPLMRRVPKFGFKNPNRVEFQVLNVSQLEYFIQKGKISSGDITPQLLYETGIISKNFTPLKILGEGEISSKVSIYAHSFSKTAKEKIEAVGGQVNIITE